MNQGDVSLKHNNDSEKKSERVTFLTEKIPSVIMAVIIIGWFFYLVAIKVQKGIQPIDWFEIFGAVFLLTGVMQFLRQMITTPRLSRPIEKGKSQKTKITINFAFKYSIIVGTLLILLSVLLPLLLKQIP